MKRRGGTDHLASSLTDLMISLMVIFILLLVTKLNNQATRTERSITYVMSQLQTSNLLHGEKLRREGDVLVVGIPQELMSFKEAKAEQGGADLSPQGRQYLRTRMPEMADLLCRPDIQNRVDAIIVEGHSDKKGFGTGDDTADKQENLKLSQQRSMAVVTETLNILGGQHRSCFLDLLSATGRGDAHPLNTRDLYSPENRRVELRIRVKPDTARPVAASLGGSIQN